MNDLKYINPETLQEKITIENRNLESDDELEEDMKDEIDSVMGLLDRLKEERKQELMSSQTTNGDKHMTRIETQVSGNRRPPEEPIDVKIRLNRDESRDEEEDDLQEGYREGQQKRKQDTIIAELREKAQIISKSARKGPEDVASALSKTHHIEDDPESAQYLRKIRDANAVEASEDKENKAEKKVERSVVTVDFPTPISPRKTSVTVKLNLDMQKSKIAVARGSGLQGRRKPTTEHIRRSLMLSDDEEPEDVLAAGYEAEHEDMDGEVNAAISPVETNSLESADPLMFGKPIEAKIMPTSPVEYGQKINLERRGSFEGLIPRSTPKERKPAWKSKTYGGVALPAFAEAMKAGSKSLKKTDTAEKLLTADIVKQAALNKLNKAAKEDRPEKEPETPDWMVEAESRRKHHDRRRKAVKQKTPQPESNGIPIRLKATGSKIFQDENEIQQTTESVPQEDSEKNRFVVKLKPVRTRGNKPTFEPEEAKISFKLKSTGIQLIKPEETPEEPESAKPEPTSIEREPEPPRILREEPERPVVPAEVKYFEMVPRTKDIAEVNKNEEPAMQVRLRQEKVPRTKDIENSVTFVLLNRISYNSLLRYNR
ncbi:muscle M-line assembly protein unc-89-like [Actinia tenebrosa]|uniref:Muscle M-line assembly protein unc-89-like n=1 Tax=Actinia tenebrosa TaxID=6105 RepID=A0A6P8HDN6_ACTTE|nr:muscle M-line assembly protein unc-89-like [Actinia tenebrosa]